MSKYDEIRESVKALRELGLSKEALAPILKWVDDNESFPIIENILPCGIWGNCVHGAGCIMTSFKSENKGTVPEIVFVDGIPECKTFKRG